MGPRDSRRSLRRWRTAAAVNRSKPRNVNLLEHPTTGQSADQRSSNHASHDTSSHLAGDASNEQMPSSLSVRFLTLLRQSGLLDRHDSQPQVAQHAQIVVIEHNVWLIVHPPRARARLGHVFDLSPFLLQEQQEKEQRKQILDQIMTAEARVRLSNIGASEWYNFLPQM